jgi:hypothetical protein
MFLKDDGAECRELQRRSECRYHATSLMKDVGPRSYSVKAVLGLTLLPALWVSSSTEEPGVDAATSS